MHERRGGGGSKFNTACIVIASNLATLTVVYMLSGSGSSGDAPAGGDAARAGDLRGTYVPAPPPRMAFQSPQGGVAAPSPAADAWGAAPGQPAYPPAAAPVPGAAAAAAAGAPVPCDPASCPTCAPCPVMQQQDPSHSLLATAPATKCPDCPVCPPAPSPLAAPAPPVCPPCVAAQCAPCPQTQSRKPRDPRWDTTPLTPPAMAPPGALERAAKSRDAVIGLAKGIKFEWANRFVRTLRQSAPTASIVIFTDNVDGPIGALYRAWGVDVQLYNEADFEPKVQNYHPSSYRWILIYNYLRSLPEPFDRVMFCDARDTVFQADPFRVVTQPGLYAFLEAGIGQGGKTISQCGWNSKWVSDCFGFAVLKEIGDNVISCSGTSMATWDHGLMYAKMMHDEISTNKCERNGVDQGMHNVFVWQRRISPLYILSNEDGPIATVQSMKEVHKDWFGRAINNKLEVYSVVHQYDRSEGLKYDLEAITPFALPRGVDPDGDSL